MIPAEIIVTLEAGVWPAEFEALLTRAAAAALTAALPASPPAVELGITLSDDAAVRELNRDHRQQDKPTNVLSFPLIEAPLAPGALVPPAAGVPVLLGDVVLADATCAAEAAAQGKPLADHAAHLVVHGVLHLLGHDHMTDQDAEAMERLEAAILAGLGIPDPYAASPAAAARPQPASPDPQ